MASLNVQHQITTTDILHDEVNTGLGLETSMQVQQEWVPLLVSNQKHALLRFGTLNFVVLDNELLLQNLDSIKLACAFCLGQHDLSEVTFSKNSKEVKVIQSNSDLLLVLWFLFDRNNDV